MRYTWIETYRSYECVLEVDRKADLVGYCGKHGGAVQRQYKMPESVPEVAQQITEAMTTPLPPVLKVAADD